jgi:hypothetical protein
MSAQNQELPKSQFLGLEEIVTTIKGISEIADKRASTFLFSVGTGLLILAVLVKVKLFGLQVSDMNATEFVSLLVVCLGCLLSGAYVRMQQERLSNDHELKILETSLRYSLRSQQSVSETALESQKIAQQPVEILRKSTPPKPPGG